MKKQILTMAILVVAWSSFAQTGNLVLDVNFNNRTGAFSHYDEAMARQDFGPINNRGTGAIRGLDKPGTTWRQRTRAGERNLRLHYPKNIAGGGNSGIIFVKNITPSEEATMEYRIKFDDNWFFCYGGKLPGLAGSVNPNGALPWGGTENRRVVHSAFSTRLMWRRHKNLVIYAYLPERINSSGRVVRKWGEDIEFFRGVVPGRWYTIRQYVKMNTPGQKNGILEMYVDGKRTLRRTNIEYRLRNQDVKVNAAAIHSYRGGGATNKNFHSNKDEHIYFDYFRVWTGGQGGGTPPPPPPEPTAYTLTTTVSGQGTVATSPKESEYDPGTEVTLTATPAKDMVFTGWSGDVTGTTNPLKVTMSENRAVNAFFTQKIPSGTERLSIVSAQASAEQNDDHLKELSYDGDPETRWANDNTPENNWIIYDLGDQAIVNAVKLMLNVGETRTYPLKIEVGGSTDNFTEVWSGDLPPNIGLHTIIVTEATGRYVRVSMTGPNSDESNWFSIFQAEVWGETQGTSIISPTNAHAQFATFNQIQGGFTVTAPGASAKLEVFDLKGKLLFQKSALFENSFIPVRQNGVYFLRLSQGGKQINQRLVIQN